MASMERIGLPYGLSALYVPKFTPKDHPVAWRHDEPGNLEVTINLPQLRPHPPARLQHDDVVVIVDNPDLESITVPTIAHRTSIHGKFRVDHELPGAKTQVARVTIFGVPRRGHQPANAFPQFRAMLAVQS